MNEMRITRDHQNIIKKIEVHHRYQANRRNLVFLYGPSRSGKTIALKMIEEYLSRIKGIRVFRSDVEDMIAELIRSIRNTGGTEEFYHKFHNYDAILVDNIWVLRGRPRTGQETFNLLKVLIDKGKLVVIASDIPPETILQDSRTIKELRERSIIFKMKPFNPSK